MENKDYESLQDELYDFLEERKFKTLQTYLDDMNVFDIAEFITELGETHPKYITTVFRLLSKDRGAEVFAELEAEEQEAIIYTLSDAELTNIIEDMYVDDAVDMMEELPANVVKRVMKTATAATRALINQYLKYPEDSAGTIMTAEFIDLKKYMNVREAIARIRRIGADKETIYVCYVTAADRKLEGVISVKQLLLADDETLIGDIMDTNVIFAMTNEDQEEVSSRFSDYDLLAMPVVDREGLLVGIVTVDDVIDVLQEEATEDIELMAAITPSDKPYLKLSVMDIWKNRIPWLMLLMISSTFTSMIIASFEDALAVQVALVGFIPMLMGTSGNSGSQAAVTIVRGLSLGEIEMGDLPSIWWKEARVAICCGACLSFVNFFKILLIDGWLMKNDSITAGISAVICISLFFTVFCAKLVGCTLPVVAEKLGFDPAVTASPFITTIVDALSLLIYFAFATQILGI